MFKNISRKWRLKRLSVDDFYNEEGQFDFGLGDPHPDHDEVEDYKYVKPNGYVRNRPLSDKSWRVRRFRKKLAKRGY